MKEINQYYTLKTGEQVFIREAKSSDSAELLETIREYVFTSKYLLVSADDLEQTVADQREWIRSLNDNPNSLLLIAEHEGKIIGNIDLTGSMEFDENPTGMLSMGILKAYQGKGLGSILLRLVLDWARANHQLKVLCLQVFQGNQSAINLYLKAGFTVFGQQGTTTSSDATDSSNNTIMTLNL